MIQSKDAQLQAYADKMKAAGAKVTQQASTMVSIEETIPAKPAPAYADSQNAYAGPPYIEDEYGRFHFDLPTGPLTRKQLFRFDAVVVKRLNGQYQFMKADFREYVPGKEPSEATEIPVQGIDTKSQFQFLEEAAPGPKAIHLRLLAAADYRAALGVGVQLANLHDRANVSLLGFYYPKGSEARAVVQVGYRLKFPFIDSNVSVGPYYGVSSKGGAVVGGAVAIELTR